MNVEERYKWACTTPSDISLHVPVLLDYGRKCSHITEFGVRGGVSTSAWLMARPKKLRCYDINQCACVPDLQIIANSAGVDFEFTQANTASVKIEPTELLFLDTLHTGPHLANELRNHEQVSRYLVFHDTHQNGWAGENGGPGLKATLIEFLLHNIQWRISYHTDVLNGLTILERCSAPS